MEKKLRMTPEEVLEQAVKAVRLGAQPDAATSSSRAEDGGRSEIDFLVRVVEAVINAGATTINMPDTVGYAIPELFGDFIKHPARDACPTPTRRCWSVHCHNDLGMAVANSLAGGADRRRAPGRVHHQRPGRARRQLPRSKRS